VRIGQAILPGRWTAAALGAVFCALICSIAGADPVPPTAPDKPDPFPAGHWTIDTYFSYDNQPWGREQLYGGVIGADYYFWSNWSFGLEFKGLDALQPGPNAASFGADLKLRTHLLVRQNWSIFSDVCGGILESSHRIPPTGTDFNFTIATGFGFTRHLWDHTDLLGGIRYLHLSNARQEGPDRNPSLNAVEGYIGLLFKL
jgi:hypothetical protein